MTLEQSSLTYTISQLPSLKANYDIEKTKNSDPFRKSGKLLAGVWEKFSLMMCLWDWTKSYSRYPLHALPSKLAQNLQTRSI